MYYKSRDRCELDKEGGGGSRQWKYKNRKKVLNLRKEKRKEKTHQGAVCLFSLIAMCFHFVSQCPCLPLLHDSDTCCSPDPTPLFPTGVVYNWIESKGGKSISIKAILIEYVGVGSDGHD
jgi:hypothetical protein